MNQTVRGIRMLFACFICIFLFLMELFFMFVVSVERFVAPEFIEHTVMEADIPKLIEEESSSSLDYIYRETEKYDISRDTVNKVLNSENFKEFTLDYINNYIDEIYNDVALNNVTEEKIMRLTNDIILELSGEGISISAEEANKFYNIVDNRSSDIVNYLTEIDNSLFEYLGTDKLLGFEIDFFSTLVNIIIIGIIIFIIVAVGLTLWSLYKWAYYVGVTTILSSSLIFALGFILNFVLRLNLDFEFTELERLMIYPLGKILMFAGVAGLISGLILVFVALLIDNLKKEKKDTITIGFNNKKETSVVEKKEVTEIVEKKETPKKKTAAKNTTTKKTITENKTSIKPAAKKTTNTKATPKKKTTKK